MSIVRGVCVMGGGRRVVGGLGVVNVRATTTTRGRVAGDGRAVPVLHALHALEVLQLFDLGPLPLPTLLSLNA